MLVCDSDEDGIASSGPLVHRKADKGTPRRTPLEEVSLDRVEHITGAEASFTPPEGHERLKGNDCRKH